jgi:RNA polymerase sigma-70 factor (ECF subfamily)
MASHSVTCRQPGREQAFLELITGVEGELQEFIRHRVGSRHGAQDIVQKTFLQAWRDAKFDPGHIYARAWLFNTARRLSIDWLRAEQSHSISLGKLSERARRNGSHAARSVDPKARDPLIALIDEERSRNLNAAIATLPAEQREILERYYLRQEGTQLEIAEMMGLTLAAFNSRLNRARMELKRAILLLRARDGWSDHDLL